MLLTSSMLDEHFFGLSIKKNSRIKPYFGGNVQQPRRGAITYIHWFTTLNEPTPTLVGSPFE
jgi:hypothetical protein